MTGPTAHISILVYKGDPLDYQQYRHTSLWIRFDDDSPAIIVHITGSAGTFEFEAGESSNPTVSRRFAKRIDVGFLTIPAEPPQVIQALQRVPIDNRSREFNCQTWVERALKMLSNHGHLSTRDYEQGIDGMVDAIAEAEDEEE